MDGGLVFARGLRGHHVGPVDRRRGLVFARTPRRAVALSDGSQELPVHSFVSGRLIACVAGGHLESGEGGSGGWVGMKNRKYDRNSVI